jgi:hypothetical protein
MAEYSLSVDDVYNYNTIDYAGDQDTYSVYLTPGYYDFDTSSSYDTTLLLTDPNNNVVGFDDDNGYGLASYIDNAFAPTEGWYTLTVADFLNDGTGDYSVAAPNAGFGEDPGWA